MQTLTFLPLKMSPDLPNRSPSTYQELHLLLSLWSILCLRPSLFSHRALTWRRQGRLTTSVPVIVVAGWWREDLVHSSSQGALHIYPGKCGWTELEWAEHGSYGRSDGSHSDPMMMNSTKYRHAPAEWQKSTTLFHHHGHQICRTTFLFLHNMGESQFKTIKARYLSEGLVPRVHGRHTGRIPPKSLVREDVDRIILFVTQYCETNAILLPGSCSWVQERWHLHPAIYHHQESSMENVLLKRAGAYSTFCKVWRHFLPHVIARPMTDLCWTCQQNSTAIVRSTNLSEAEKSEVS